MAPLNPFTIFFQKGHPSKGKLCLAMLSKKKRKRREKVSKERIKIKEIYILYVLSLRCKKGINVNIYITYT